MNLVLDIILGAGIAAWFLYALWHIKTKPDPCSGCALLGMDCGRSPSRCRQPGHRNDTYRREPLISTDEEIARARRERVRQILENSGGKDTAGREKK